MGSFKSKFACENSIDSLQKATGRLFLWTFTTVHANTWRDAASKWHDLQTRLMRQCGFCGVRVFEFHPGGHGLHIHVLTNEWFDVNSIRRVSSDGFWGRIHVEQVRNGKYVAKYLNKTSPGAKGMRRWAAFGKTVRMIASRVKDIICDSGVHTWFRKLKLRADRRYRGWALRLWVDATHEFIINGPLLV